MKKRFVGIMVVLFCFMACAGDAPGPKPPIELPFAVHQEGATVSTEVRIVKKFPYEFIFAFPWIVKSEPGSYQFMLTFPFSNNEERDRVEKVIGGSGWNTRTGNLTDPGVPIQVKVTVRIIEPAGERILEEREVTTRGLDAWNPKRLKRRIGFFKLLPGLYRVTVINLKGAPEFKNIRVLLGIYNPRIF